MLVLLSICMWSTILTVWYLVRKKIKNYWKEEV